MEKTEKSTGRQFAELPPPAKEFVSQLLSSGYSSATDYSNRLKNAITLLMSDDELGQLVSARKDQIVECCFGLANMANDLDLFLEKCEDFERDNPVNGEPD